MFVPSPSRQSSPARNPPSSHTSTVHALPGPIIQPQPDLAQHHHEALPASPPEEKSNADVCSQPPPTSSLGQTLHAPPGVLSKKEESTEHVDGQETQNIVPKGERENSISCKDILLSIPFILWSTSILLGIYVVQSLLFGDENGMI